MGAQYFKNFQERKYKKDWVNQGRIKLDKVDEITFFKYPLSNKISSEEN